MNSLHQRSGEQALREAPNPATPLPAAEPLDCHFCPNVIAAGATFHRMIVGMNLEGPMGHVPTVEEVSELNLCSDCYPRIDALMDGFLERLWEARKPDLSLAEPETEPLNPAERNQLEGLYDHIFDGGDPAELLGPPTPPSERSPALSDTQRVTMPEVFSTPYGLVDSEHVHFAEEMIAVARRAYSPSPVGFMLGIVVGQLLQAGLTVDDIQSLVERAAEATAPAGATIAARGVS